MQERSDHLVLAPACTAVLACFVHRAANAVSGKVGQAQL